MFNLNRISNFDISSVYRKSYIDSLMKILGFNFLGEGVSRRTYLSPNEQYVLKFPVSPYGVECNQNESRLYHRYKSKADPRNGIYYAPCRLIQNTILMMKAVKEIYGYTIACDHGRDHYSIFGYADYDADTIPNWASNVDCHQVGKLSNGRFVAYDFPELIY